MPRKLYIYAMFLIGIVLGATGHDLAQQAMSACGIG